MSAILTACAISGFYAGVGHCYRFEVPLELCNDKKVEVEARMRAHGQVVRFSECHPVVTRGS